MNCAAVRWPASCRTEAPHGAAARRLTSQSGMGLDQSGVGLGSLRVRAGGARCTQGGGRIRDVRAQVQRKSGG